MMHAPLIGSVFVPVPHTAAGGEGEGGGGEGEGGGGEGEGGGGGEGEGETAGAGSRPVAQSPPQHVFQAVIEVILKAILAPVNGRVTHGRQAEATSSGSEFALMEPEPGQSWLQPAEVEHSM